MLITEKINKIKTSKIEATTAKPLASAGVLQGLVSGRVAVTVCNTGEADVYIGDKDVSADNGLPIKAGEKFDIVTNSKDNIFIVGGNVTIAEYFK